VGGGSVKPLAIVEYFDVAHGGPGWYWHSDLTDEPVGSFRHASDAALAAMAKGYRVEVRS